MLHMSQVAKFSSSYLNLILCLTKSNITAHAGSRQFSQSVYTSPAVLNSHSFGAELAGALKKHHTTPDTCGYRHAVSHHLAVPGLQLHQRDVYCQLSAVHPTQHNFLHHSRQLTDQRPCRPWYGRKSVQMVLIHIMTTSTKHTNSFWLATNIAHPHEFSRLQHDAEQATFWALITKIASKRRAVFEST